MEKTVEEIQLNKYLDAIIYEYQLALTSLTLLKVIGAAELTFPEMYKTQFFLWAIHWTTLDHLTMTAARLLDESKECLGLNKLCNFALSNISAFEPPSPSPVKPELAKLEAKVLKARVKKVCGTCQIQAKEHRLQMNIKAIRDKRIAHRDKDGWLNPELGGVINASSLEAFFRDVGIFIDCFSELANRQTDFDVLIDQVEATSIEMICVQQARLDRWKELKDREEPFNTAVRNNRARLKNALITLGQSAKETGST